MLYPEKEPLAVPDCTKTYATRQVCLPILKKKIINFQRERFLFSDGANIHMDSFGEKSQDGSHQLASRCAKFAKETS